MPLIFSPILASITSFPAAGKIVAEDWIVPQSPQPEDTLIRRCVFLLVPRPLTISLLMESQGACSVPLRWLLLLTWHHHHRPGNYLDISNELQSLVISVKVAVFQTWVLCSCKVEAKSQRCWLVRKARQTGLTVHVWKLPIHWPPWLVCLAVNF